MNNSSKKPLTKMGEQVIINLYDNGYMVEVNGRNDEGDWTTVKNICSSDEELFAIIKSYLLLPRDE